MIRIITPLVALLFLGNFSFAQIIPNGNFEDWEFNWDYEEDSLKGWKCGYVYGQENQPISKSEDAQDGNYSLMVVDPSFKDVTNEVYVTIPYTLVEANALIGYYKATLFKNAESEIADSASVTVTYFKGTKNVKAKSQIYFNMDATEWTFFQFRIAKSEEADSIRIHISSSVEDQKSQLWIDNISFGTYVGVDDIAETVDFEIYPNPASQFVNVVTNKSNARIELLNITGQVLQVIDNSNQQTVTINKGQYEAGVYLIRVSNEDGSVVKKINFK